MSEPNQASEPTQTNQTNQTNQASEPGGDPEVVRRRAARVVVVDADGRVLMIEGFDPHHPDQPYWYTIGGGVEPGETDTDAAVREVWEETGRTISGTELVGPIHDDTAVFAFEGRTIVQEQVFYGWLTERFDAVPAGFAGAEVRSTLQLAWIDPAARRTAGEAIYPVVLERLVEAVLDAGALSSE